MGGDGRGKRKANDGEASKHGEGAKKARGPDAVADVKSTDALEVGGRASRGSTDDVSATLGGDGASSVDTSLTLDMGATATRVWRRNRQWVAPEVSTKLEFASNSGGAARSDDHNASAAEGLVPAVDAAPSTESSRNDPGNTAGRRRGLGGQVRGNDPSLLFPFLIDARSSMLLQRQATPTGGGGRSGVRPRPGQPEADGGDVGGGRIDSGTSRPDEVALHRGIAPDVVPRSSQQLSNAPSGLRKGIIA